jgi:hypothetical protein
LLVEMAISKVSVKAAYELFDELKCCSDGPRRNGDFTSDAALALLDIEKLKCHIVNCLAALNVVEIKTRHFKNPANEQHEVVKRKVFEGACSMIINAELDANQTAIKKSVLSAFPDKCKITNGQSWLPLHFAIVLFAEGKISEEDVQTLYSIDPMAMHRLSNNKNDDEEEEEVAADHDALAGCTPAHLLCMQKQPTMSLVRFFCLCNPQAFLLCNQKGRCVLHLVVMFSESSELLQSMLQIDHSMTNKKIAKAPMGRKTALGLLCARVEFPFFKEMVTSLIGVDCSVAVISDGIIGCMLQIKESSFTDTSPGSGGEKILDLIKVLLNANPEVADYDNSNIFHEACCHLRGQLGIAVLTFFLTKNGDGIRSLSTDGNLPIHYAASYSTVDMLIFLHKAYPESISILVPNDKFNLLHFAIDKEVDIIAKLEYLCEQCPQLTHMKDNYGETPLHAFLYLCHNKLDLKVVKVFCDADETVVRDKCTPSDIDFDSIPLHLLISYRSLPSEVSDEADCFRLFLRLYSSSAGIKNGHLKSPYDLAVTKNLNHYFLRLLLASDPTIDPVKLKDLNFEARREGMFLAFRALSSTVKPTIWAKLRYENVNLLARVLSYL